MLQEWREYLTHPASVTSAAGRKTMKKIILVRHGNTFGKSDILLRAGKHTDLDLVESEKGRKAGKYIKDLNVNIRYAFCGPLRRHYQTILLINQYVGFGEKNIVIDERFNEVDYGEHDGMPEKQVVADLGEKALSLWESDAIPPPQWPINTDSIKKDWQVFLREIAATPDEEDTIVVTSSGNLRFLPTVIMMNPRINLKVNTGGIVILQTDLKGDWSVLSWGINP